MRHAAAFLEKMRSGQVCYGAAINSFDPLLTEALGTLVEGLWIDAEHAPLSIESLQNLVIAAQLSGAAAFVRVPNVDPVRIKPVLDLGVDGVIVPMIRSAEDAALAVSSCRYPPEGVRGFGPRRAGRFGHYGSWPEYVDYANEHVIVTVQIEHVDAVEAIDEILATPGLGGVVIGANDLSFSMGYPAQPNHPEVVAAIDRVAAKVKASDKFLATATGGDVDNAMTWIERGVSWLVMETETSLMMMAAGQLYGAVRERVESGAKGQAAKR